MRRPSRLPPRLPRLTRLLPALVAVQWLAALVHAHRHHHQTTALVYASVLVLGPVAIICLYRIGVELAGRWLGYLAATLWVVTPYAIVPLYDTRFRHGVSQEIVPRAIGTTQSGELVVAVLLLLACLLTLRAIDRGGWRGLTAGLLAGAAGMVDAAGLLFVAPALVALLAAGRLPQLLRFSVGVAAGLLVVRAAGTGSGVHYGSFHQLQHNFTFIREYFYSLRALEFLPIAGAIAIARRSPPAALLIGGWFAAFLMIRGSSTEVLDGSFYRMMLPALPAYVLLAASIPLLAPAPRAFRSTVLARRPRVE